MGARDKGNRAERKAVEELEKEGWETYRVKGSTMFNKNVDIFGLFDIVGVHPDKREVILVQVKSNQMPSMIPFREFRKKYIRSTLKMEIWVWKDYYGFEKREILAENLDTPVDMIVTKV